LHKLDFALIYTFAGTTKKVQPEAVSLSTRKKEETRPDQTRTELNGAEPTASASAAKEMLKNLYRQNDGQKC